MAWKGQVSCSRPHRVLSVPSVLGGHHCAGGSEPECAGSRGTGKPPHSPQSGQNLRARALPNRFEGGHLSERPAAPQPSPDLLESPPLPSPPHCPSPAAGGPWRACASFERAQTTNGPRLSLTSLLGEFRGKQDTVGLLISGQEGEAPWVHRPQFESQPRPTSVLPQGALVSPSVPSGTVNGAQNPQGCREPWTVVMSLRVVAGTVTG